MVEIGCKLGIYCRNPEEKEMETRMVRGKRWDTVEFWIHIEYGPNKASWWIDGRVKEDFKVYSLNNCENEVDLDLSSSGAPPALKYERQLKIIFYYLGIGKKGQNI